MLKIKRMVIEVMFERKKVRLYLRWQDVASLECISVTLSLNHPEKGTHVKNVS